MKPQKVIIGLFFGALVVLPVLTLALPKKDRSELENRTLQAPPVLSVSNLLDKSFMQDCEKYMTDHFVGRTELVKSKTVLELAQAKKEVNGVFVDDKMLLEKINPANNDIATANINAINEFAEKYKDKIQTSVAIIPSAVEMYPQNAPPFADTLDQSAFITDFYSRLTNTSNIDIYSKLLSEADNYIYYRTDHHWTSYGAYVGYTAMANTLGFKPASNFQFNIEHASYDFLGTIYSKVLCGEKLADTVDLYTFAKQNPVTEVIKYDYSSGKKPTPVSYPSVFFREYLDTRNQYGVFLGENEPVVKIKTLVDNNKKIILFKDSYSRALMQFLPLHFEEIVLVDLRYIKLPLSDYIDINDYTNAMFIYYVNGLIDDKTIPKVTSY